MRQMKIIMKKNSPTILFSLLQVLSGHTDEVCSGVFSYNGDIIMTASKDNTCKIWK